MVASTIAYSMSGSSETASKIRLKTPAFDQSLKRLNTVFHLPKCAGRSRQGLPVRAIQSTASTNSRLSLPLRPGSLGFPRAMRFHLRPLGVGQNELFHPELKSHRAIRWNPESQQALGYQDAEAQQWVSALMLRLRTEENVYKLRTLTSPTSSSTSPDDILSLPPAPRLRD